MADYHMKSQVDVISTHGRIMMGDSVIITVEDVCSIVWPSDGLATHTIVET